MWAFQYRKNRRRVRALLVYQTSSKTHPTASRYFTFLTACTNPKACTILLRGPSKDILNEIDRNLADALSVARNVYFNPTLAPGGGATEMAISVGLHAKARSVTGVEGWPFRAVADAIEVIPRTLVQNSGGNAIRVLTELRAKHANGENSWGVNGETGKIVDMKSYGLYESASVKVCRCLITLLLPFVDDRLRSKYSRQRSRFVFSILLIIAY